MKSNPSGIPKFLKWIFAIIEVFAIVGLLALTALFAVGKYRASFEEDESKAFGLIRTMEVGTFEISIPRDLYVAKFDGVETGLVSVVEASAVVELEDPAMIRAFWKEMGSSFFAMLWLYLGLTIVGCDLFRRMFRSVERRETFTPQTIKTVHKIGILFIASAIAGSLFLNLLVSDLNRFAAKHIEIQGIAIGAIHEDALDRANLIFSLTGTTGVIVGLMVLALGEAFRQGLKLKEENDLTI